MEEEEEGEQEEGREAGREEGEEEAGMGVVVVMCWRSRRRRLF